ncbi:MAG: glycosyltransferase [Myxococcota bacterium]|nr:glycosyltransferase [Myxococcota bacterium]
MRRVILAAPEAWCAPTWRASRIRRYLEWLSQDGGGTFIGPMGSEGPCLLPGIVHEDPIQDFALPSSEVAPKIAELLKEKCFGTTPLVIHALGIEAGLGGLMGRRGKNRVIIEPGVREVHILKDRFAIQSETAAEGTQITGGLDGVRARLAALDALEEHALKRADAVIASSTVEAAHLAQIVQDPGRLVLAPFGVSCPAGIQDADLPRIAVYVGQHGGQALDFFYRLAERLKENWRAVLVYNTPDSQVVRATRIPERFHGRIDWCEVGDGLDFRLAGCQIVLCARPMGRMLLSGALNPDEVNWGLSRALPLIAPDFDVIRASAGPAAAYYPPSDADECAAIVDTVLANRGERQRLAQASLAQAKQLTWDAAAAAMSDCWRILQLD